MDRELADELERMAREDQDARRAMPSAGGLSVDDQMRCTRLDVAHADRLRAIVERHGWPGRGLVGEEGAQHAWLIAQHADRQLDLQRVFLGRLEEAVRHGEASHRQLACLTDRVRVNEGRRQLYGTQMWAMPGQEPEPWPIEDEPRLDERRAAMGLEPFEQYRSQFSALR